MRNSVYVTINDNYTATVYSLQDLKDYVEFEKLNPATFTIHKEETGDTNLTKVIKKYIESFKKPSVVVVQRDRKVRMGWIGINKWGIDDVTVITEWSIRFNGEQVFLTSKWITKADLIAMCKSAMKNGHSPQYMIDNYRGMSTYKVK
jgi:hypothetical protein